MVLDLTACAVCPLFIHDIILISYDVMELGSSVLSFGIIHSDKSAFSLHSFLMNVFASCECCYKLCKLFDNSTFGRYH